MRMPIVNGTKSTAAKTIRSLMSLPGEVKRAELGGRELGCSSERFPASVSPVTVELMQVQTKPASGWTAGTTLLVWMMVVWTVVDLIVFTVGRDQVPWVYIVSQSIILAQFATLA